MMRRFPLLALLAAAACAASGDEDVASGDNALNETVAFADVTRTAIPKQGCADASNPGCYTNYAITADLDGDGNLDLLMANGGGHFVTSDDPSVVDNVEPQVAMFGDGRGSFAEIPGAFSGGKDSMVRQVAVADFDGDGRLDIYMPGGFGKQDDQLFMQTAARRFTNQPARLGRTRQSTAGAVHAGDDEVDVADWGTQPNPDDDGTPVSKVIIRILTNDGNGNFAESATLDTVAITSAEGGSTSTDIDLQDVDGDFSLDILLTQRNGQSRIYLNDGKGTFTDVTRSKALPKKVGPFTFNAELCDVDSDGDLDLIWDNGGHNRPGGHNSQLLINDGTGEFTDETDRIVGEPRADDNQVKCVDVDNDGDFDLVVASLTNAKEKLLRNIDGKGNFKFENVFPATADPSLAIDVGDFDGDGKVDVFTAQGEGRPATERIYKNMTANSDRRKPVFRKVEEPTALAGKPTVFRFAVSDAHTSETGQHVKNVFVEVAGQKIPARFIGGDIYRADIPSQPGAFKATPHATDRAGNEAVGTAVDVTP